MAARQQSQILLFLLCLILVAIHRGKFGDSHRGSFVVALASDENADKDHDGGDVDNNGGDGGDDNNDNDNNEDDEDDEDDSIVQLNPEYEEKKTETSSIDEDDNEEDTEKSKSVLSDALKKKKGKKKSKGAVSKSPTIWKKHRSKIMIGLALYAFRKDIGKIVWRLLSTPDPSDSGNRRVRNPNSLVKVFLIVRFLWIIRGIGTDQDWRNPEASGDSGNIFSRILNMNPAYLPPIEQRWTFQRINERYDKDIMALNKAMGIPTVPAQSSTKRKKEANTKKAKMDKKNGDSRLSLKDFVVEFFQSTSSRQKTDSTTTTTIPYTNGTVIILDLTGPNLNAKLDTLHDQVSFLLYQHRRNHTRLNEETPATANPSPVPDINSTLSSINITSNDGEDSPSTTMARMEVVLLLESPGGSASDYGLAAQQLLRLRNEPGVHLTVCVDRVAASGGYMLAVTGHRLLVAPFAVVGSIGVYSQSINVQRALEGFGARTYIFRAGKNKAPLGWIGDVTKDGMNSIQSFVNALHLAFQQHVVSSRPVLEENLNLVSTGEVWAGLDAIDLGLADELMTSEEYLTQRLVDNARVLQLVRNQRRTFFLESRRTLVSAVRTTLTNARRMFAETLQSLLVTGNEDFQQPQMLHNDPGWGLKATTTSATGSKQL